MNTPPEEQDPEITLLRAANTRLQMENHGLYEKLRQGRAAALMLKIPPKLKADLVNVLADPRRNVKVDATSIARARGQ